MAEGTIKMDAKDGFINLGTGAVQDVTVLQFSGIQLTFGPIDQHKRMQDTQAILDAIPPPMVSVSGALAFVGVPRYCRDIVASLFLALPVNLSCLIFGDSMTSLKVYWADDELYDLQHGQPVGPVVFDRANKHK